MIQKNTFVPECKVECLAEDARIFSQLVHCKWKKGFQEMFIEERNVLRIRTNEKLGWDQEFLFR